MTAQIIPAQKGYFALLNKGRMYWKIPVIAWQTGEDGTLQPVTAEPIFQRVILYPNGRIFDQDRQIGFDDECDWWAEVRQ